MAVNAGFNCAIKLSGTSTAFTGQTMTNTTGKTYQIGAAYRVLDPDTTPTIYDNASPVSAGDIDSIDYLQGTVTFDAGYTVTGTVTADGDYYPMFAGPEVYGHDFQRMREMLETTVYGQGERRRIAGLVDASITLSTRDDGQTDIDTGGGTQTLQAIVDGGSPVVVEMSIGTTPDKTYRFWAVPASLSPSAGVDDLVDTSIEFQLAAYRAADGTEVGVTSF